MTLTCTLLAFVVALAAAVRSTWSPCGLSMLSTITPVSERAKGHRYGATCAWFVVGATVGGLSLGGLIAGLAVVVRTVGPGPVVVGTVALVGALVVLVSDTGLAGARVPVHFRQVNERWLDAYRPWVYGAGFGFQIGTGVATYITTGAVYLMVVLGALTGDPLVALALGGAFGLVRGLAVLLTRRITTPSGLLLFHQRFTSLRPRADRAVLVALGITVVVLDLVLIASGGTVPVVVATVVVGVGTLVVRAVVRSTHPVGPVEPGRSSQGSVDSRPAGTPAQDGERSVAVG